MADLPTGTVTFLFTDIEGSTQLLQRLGPRYAAVLAEYRTLLRAIFTQHGGHEVDTQGDRCFVAFLSWSHLLPRITGGRVSISTCGSCRGARKGC